MTTAMMHYRWEWQLQANPEALWPFVADTNRLNRDTGVPAVHEGPVASKAVGQGGTGRRQLSLRRFGVPVVWDEEPFEWARPWQYGVVRRYRSGPLAQMTVLVELIPRTGGTKLVYQVWAQPRGPLGGSAVRAQVGFLSARSLDQAFKRYDRAATARQAPVLIPSAVRLTAGGRERLAAVRAKLLAQGADAALLTRLIETIEQGDDLVVARLRPYALADAWGASRHGVLTLCLLATRAGLLNLRWCLICPYCRGAKETSETLSELDTAVHCEHCNIDVRGNLDRLVELTFAPNPAVREVAVAEYCVGGPQVTPHICAQQLLGPRGQRQVTLPLEPGHYRLRLLNVPGTVQIVASEGGPAAATIRTGGEGWPAEDCIVGLRPTLTLVNETGEERLAILERIAWSDQAATAAEVIAQPLFRDLFSREVVRLGEGMGVGSLTILFTDLKGSTRLYREIGDAPAFGHVFDHFTIVRRAIEAEEGVLVKTIGDAVMAAFPRPVAGVRAMIAAQRHLDEATASTVPLRLKAGLHHGPCIAVTLNDRLDYFGTTVNMASRLEGLSSGDDVVVTGAVYDDPEVAAFVAESGGMVEAVPFSAPLKGFEGDSVALWRIRQHHDEAVGVGNGRQEGHDEPGRGH